MYAEVIPGCPSFGGQRTAALARQVEFQVCFRVRAVWHRRHRPQLTPQAAKFASVRAVRPSAASGRPYRLEAVHAKLLLSTSTEAAASVRARPISGHLRVSVAGKAVIASALVSTIAQMQVNAAHPALAPNPSIERTTSGKLRLPPVAAHVER